VRKLENEARGLSGPSEVISALILAHLKFDDSNIKLHEGLHLEPMINHRGKMSVSAYRMSYRNAWKKWRRFTNANRPFVGILDFKIIDPNGKMEHDILLREVMTLLTAEHVRDLYYGRAPGELDLDEEQMVVATNLMCSFIEQEVNWGVHHFQLHTNFGSTEFNRIKCEYLENAVPRDYFCSHILYLFDQMECNPGQKVDLLVDEFLLKWLTGSPNANKRIIRYPVRKESVMPSHREFMLSHEDEAVRPWIESHLGEISRVCEVVGKNPRWDRFYEIDLEGNVRIIVDHPLKSDGLDWPIIELR